MFKKLLVVLALSMVAALLFAACGDDDPTATPAAGTGATPPATGNGDAIHVQMLDTMRFDPDTINVSPGQEVTIDLENAGAIVHSFSLRGHEEQVDYHLDGRQRETFTFTAPSEPGEYEIYCDVPGHEQAGMVGTLVVQ
jgi:plastocyanin